MAAGAYPMGFSVHWDGTTSRGLQAVPICVGVANTNSSRKDTQFCLGYIPKLSHMGKQFLASTVATEIKFAIRQQAVAAVLRVLENGARSGILCSIKNVRGKDVTVLLMPRLLTVPIDQPEAQLYFGLKNRWVCSKCSRREGYSAFRKSRKQSGPRIQCLYQIFNGNPKDSTRRKRARSRLEKSGFNPERHCTMTEVADKLLVRVPRVPRSLSVFPCGDFRDKMHGMYIFFFREITASLNRIKWQSKKGLKVKEILDDRLAEVCIQGTLRDPATSRSLRIQKSIFSDVDMSATDRMYAVFLLPHVFGHKGNMIPTDVRASVLTAIARAQLMLIAVRGRREYTMSELRTIFDDGYCELFAALEHIHAVQQGRRYDASLKSHLQNPDKYPPPKRFKSHR